MQQKRVFISWSSHRSFLPVASAALSFPPYHSHPLPSWRLGSMREQRKPLSWRRNYHGNMALSPAHKDLSHAWLLDLAQMRHMRVFLMAHSVVILSYLSPPPPGRPILLASVHFRELNFSFSLHQVGGTQPQFIYVFHITSQPYPKLLLWFRAPGKSFVWINMSLRRERDTWRKGAALLGWWGKCWWFR